MKKAQKLTLHRETLRRLNDVSIQAVAGGLSNQPPQCPQAMPTVVHSCGCND